MTFLDRFMLSFMFGYIAVSMLINLLNVYKHKKDSEHIHFMGTKNMTKEEMDALIKILGQDQTEDEDEEDE